MCSCLCFGTAWVAGAASAVLARPRIWESEGNGKLSFVITPLSGGGAGGVVMRLLMCTDLLSIFPKARAVACTYPVRKTLHPARALRKKPVLGPLEVGKAQLKGLLPLIIREAKL